MSPTIAATIRLTLFQTQEVSWGLDIDMTDPEGAGEWGTLRPVGKGKAADLDVYDLNAAILRVTSSRDICRDNADSGWGSHAHARSLQLLTDKLVAAAGGPDALPAETRRWLP